MTIEELKETLGSGDIGIRIAVVDIDGVLRGKIIHREKFFQCLEGGLGFCDVIFGWNVNDQAYTNGKVTGWHTGFPDAPYALDLDTYRVIPWEEERPFFLGDFSGSNSEVEKVCPRTLLKKVQAECVALGYQPLFTQEFEWFNFMETPHSLAAKGFVNPQPLSPGMFGYSLLRPSASSDYFSDLFSLMDAFDVPLEGLHTETGPGVYEACTRPNTVLEAADQAALLKLGVREIAYKHGIMASFMAKWNASLPGCSGHVHQSLWDEKVKTNLFFDTSDANGMSKLFKSYLAGQLACLPYLLPFYAPTVNSYKRLVEGAWAPTTVTWGIDNRTAALRVLTPNEKLTRLETRVPGSDTNPYLAMAAALASGLYGIKKQLSLEESATVGNAYLNTSADRLSSNLKDATTLMRNSPIAAELFGEAFIDHFARTREFEWQQYSSAVTDWELRQYFEII